MSRIPARHPTSRPPAAFGLEPNYPEIRRTPDGQIDYDWYLLRARETRTEAYRGAFRAIGRFLGAAYRAWIKDLRAWRERKRALAELLSLDDRQLRDMGLNRAGVYFAVDHGREDAPSPANVNAKQAHRAA